MGDKMKYTVEEFMANKGLETQQQFSEFFGVIGSVENKRRFCQRRIKAGFSVVVDASGTHLQPPHERSVSHRMLRNNPEG